MIVHSQNSIYVLLGIKHKRNKNAQHIFTKKAPLTDVHSFSISCQCSEAPSKQLTKKMLLSALPSHLEGSSSCALLCFFHFMFIMLSVIDLCYTSELPV